MPEGYQTVYRQFVVGPAQRATHHRRSTYYPALIAIAGDSAALRNFFTRIASAGSLQDLADAFAPAAANAVKFVGEEAVARQFPAVAAAVNLFDQGDAQRASALLRAHLDEPPSLVTATIEPWWLAWTWRREAAATAAPSYPSPCAQAYS